MHGFSVESGNDLLSRGVTTQVPLALRSLTAVFEMRTGDPSRYSHRKYYTDFCLSFNLFNLVPQDTPFKTVWSDEIYGHEPKISLESISNALKKA